MAARTRRGVVAPLSVLVLLILSAGVLGAIPTSARAPRRITVPVPTGTSGLCRASASVAPQVTIPARAGVEYRLDGRRVASGPITVSPGTHTVRAISRTLRLSGQTTFRLVLRGAGQCGGAPTSTSSTSASHGSSGYGAGALVGRVSGSSVVAAPTAFTDSVCAHGRATGSSYRVPFVSGLTYEVDGKDQAPGTHDARDGATVTVVAMAARGHTLSGITQWTHTFRAPTGCPAPGPSTRNATGSTTHDGVSSLAVVTLGTILVLSGAGALLVASRRRRRGATGRP